MFLKILSPIENVRNQILIESRTKKVFKLKCSLINTDAILQDQEKVRIVKVNYEGEFITSIINANAVLKTVNFFEICLRPVDNIENTLNFDDNDYIDFEHDRNIFIKKQFRIEHLSEEETERLTNLSLDIFYLEENELTFKTK